MTPEQFLSQAFATADELALRLAGTREDHQSAFLRDFERRVRSQWREVFAPWLCAADTDGMVLDLVERVRKRRDFLERFGKGSA
jgi:hypothetical protein